MKTEKMRGDLVLGCPACKEGWLHQKEVVVYFRGEDEAHGISVTVSDGGVSASSNGSQENNPSFRRDGLGVEFECETCHEKPVFQMVQHKGNTYLGWATGEEIKQIRLT